MHLRSIRLRGFKSFPDAVEVKLEPGVAVVVGPNGSGKSNVADAIVWAAGSLTPSEMRAERPDDVLFGGAEGRPGADNCEVELVFDNEDGGFGEELDYSEIAITRRLVRGGEGQYLVNKAPVRRIDLVELLADVGLGGSMHSIVSQGKVEAVLASKPEDRRHLVEEAAGLGKFKRRKHRAELKLARVGIQVERARDVEEEVRKRLRPLALQATAAERAEKLAVELGGLRARLARLDLVSINERRAAADDRRQAAALARRTTQESLAKLLAEREQTETELSDASGKREAILGSLYRLRSASERLGLRRESAGAVRARLDEDLVEAKRALSARSDETLRGLEESAGRAAAEAREAASESGRATERARLAHARVAAFDRRVAREAELRLDELRSARRKVEAGLAEATGGQAGANRLLVALGAARERLAARRENTSALIDRLARDHEDAKKVTSRPGPSPLELEQAANAALTHARAAATERDDVAERARATRERLVALERSLESREGIPPAARTLGAAGERIALAALEAEPGHERAIAAALAWRASAVLAKDTRRGFELLEQARREELGSLAVIVDGPERAAGAAPLAGLQPLRELATGPDEALRLLDGIWLIDDERLIEPTRGVVVTPAGHGYDADRGELWFAGTTAEAILLELDARRRTLADEVVELDARAVAAAAAAEEAAVVASAAEAAYAEVAHLRERVVDVELLRGLELGARALDEQLARVTATVSGLEAPIAATVTSGSRVAAELGDELRSLASLEAAAQAEATQATGAAQAAEMVVARFGGTIDSIGLGLELDRTVVAAEAEAALVLADDASRVARESADRARAAEALLVERAPRRTGLDLDLLGRLLTAVDTLGADLGRAAAIGERLEAPVRARADAGAVRATELGAELRRLGAEEVGIRSRADQATERATAVEVELARLDGEAEEAERRLRDARVSVPDGEVEPEPEVSDTDPSSRDELALRIERLEARREALGRVNPLAKEEYEAEKERLDELATQRKDLEDSLGELEKLRDELAATVQRRFDETFAMVAANFEEVATTLFPGGEGRLRLVESEEEGGEPGIEVELRPAGKRITRLSLLSGGEKALGAISFLFSLFLAKPCPFYLLDEVEAALDDTNVSLFVDLLRRYADRAQFIVITHQKRTMEAADVLYGVTMGGDGISQIVSRRLPREERAAATA